ncbi:MAG: DnaD domain protein [Catonella sp.]|uniref:DnaD domain protein n=1 Tax=Catonella sp. TaxID=2382125 RepID=UPI003F9F7E87
MSEINLSMVISTGVTVISNAFIEHFINESNASHIRFYLYLMYYSQNHKSFSISSACDFLEDSEKDIIRSINYWEKQGLFKVTRTNENTITAIRISDVPDDSSTVSSDIQAETSITDNFDEDESIFTHASPNSITELDLTQVLYKAGELAGRPLSSSEIDFICELNEKLKFTTELIIYLYEYCCITKGINRFNYIENVALAWADKDILTVDAAKSEAEIFNTENATVMKSFGLSRLPGTSEKQYITKWFHTYNMSAEMVAEACSRTLIQLSKPDFKYADSILKNWFKSGLANLDDVKNGDKAHYAAKQNLKVVNSSNPKPVYNRFNNFVQREYSNEKMEDLTNKLLEKSII